MTYDEEPTVGRLLAVREIVTVYALVLGGTLRMDAPARRALLQEGGRA